MQYAIITPVYNEEENLLRMLNSVAEQTIMPTRHIVIDDCSINGTRDILWKYGYIHRWVDYINVRKRDKSVNSHVKAMNDGLQYLMRYDDWDYVSVLDADVVLDKNYFETLMSDLKESDIVSGRIVGHNHRTIRGCGRLYHRKLIQKLGSFAETPAWDTFHNFVVEMHGGRAILNSKAKMYPLRETDPTSKHLYRRGLACAILRYPLPFVVGRFIIELGFTKGTIAVLSFIVYRPMARRHKMSNRMKKHIINSHKASTRKQVRKLMRLVMSKLRSD